MLINVKDLFNDPFDLFRPDFGIVYMSRLQTALQSHKNATG